MTVRLAVTMLAVGLLAACGGQEGSSGEAETPPVAAGQDPRGQSCIEKVQQGEFQQAVPICQAALAADPDNRALRATLARAEAGINP